MSHLSGLHCFLFELLIARRAADVRSSHEFGVDFAYSLFDRRHVRRQVYVPANNLGLHHQVHPGGNLHERLLVYGMHNGTGRKYHAHLTVDPREFCGPKGTVHVTIYFFDEALAGSRSMSSTIPHYNSECTTSYSVNEEVKPLKLGHRDLCYNEAVQNAMIDLYNSFTMYAGKVMREATSRMAAYSKITPPRVAASRLLARIGESQDRDADLKRVMMGISNKR